MARRLAEELGTEVEVRPNVSLGKNEKKLEKCVKILRQLGLDVAGAEEREGGFLEPSGEPSGEEGKKNVGWTWHREEKGKGLVEKKPKVPLRNFDFGGQWEESRGDTPSDIYGSGFPRQEERLPRQDFYGRDLDSQPRVAVVVVRCDSHSRETPREELTRLFPPPFYRLKVARDKGEESEQERVSSALAWARENFPRLPVLLVKDSTVSNLPGEISATWAAGATSASSSGACAERLPRVVSLPCTGPTARKACKPRSSSLQGGMWSWGCALVGGGRSSGERGGRKVSPPCSAGR